MATKLGSKLSNIVEDITTLEVNTIICDGMTGEDMADPRHALFDIGAEYIDVLRRFHREAGLPPPDLPPEALLDTDPICGSSQVFQRLHAAANLFLAAPAAAALSNRERTLVNRIRVKSGLLVALFARLRDAEPDPAARTDNHLCRRDINGEAGPRPPPLPLGYDDRMLLRKIWELSTETIAMQTVINLSGDVVSRLQRDFISEEHAVLHRIHGEGIRVALASWGAMIQAIGDLLGALRR